MGGHKYYNTGGGFSQYLYHTEGETAIINGMRVKVIAKIGEADHHSGLPFYSNTSDVYLKIEHDGNKVEQAICHYKHKDIKKVESLVVCGGVSANKRLSQKLFYIANKYNLNLIIPSIQWTTDNAGMIAKTGCMYWNTWKQENKDFNYNPFDLSFPPLAKWEIDKI